MLLIPGLYGIGDGYIAYGQEFQGPLAADSKDQVFASAV
jgi:hypothetical protein